VYRTRARSQTLSRNASNGEITTPGDPPRGTTHPGLVLKRQGGGGGECDSEAQLGVGQARRSFVFVIANGLCVQARIRGADFGVLFFSRSTNYCTEMFDWIFNPPPARFFCRDQVTFVYNFY
jgi:hypothetical protein